MGIFSAFELLTTDSFDLHGNIEPGPLKSLFRRVNALKEHILDVAPTGIATRTFKGHDHADSGPPINRGCIYCEDNGNVPLWVCKPGAAQAYVRIDHATNGNGDTPFLRTDHAVSIGYCSPKVPSDALLLGQLHYTSVGGGFKLKILELFSNREVVVDLPENNNTQQAEIIFTGPLYPGTWDEFFVYALADKFDGQNEPELSIYSLSLFETLALTVPKTEAPL